MSEDMLCKDAAIWLHLSIRKSVHMNKLYTEIITISV